MSFALVPTSAAADRATVWVGAFDERVQSANVTLEWDTGGRTLSPGGWSSFATAGGRTLHHQRLSLVLPPGRSYPLRLHMDGALRAEARATTLPTALPATGTRPFTVLLGSCFSAQEDPAGLVGRTYLSLPPAARPDLKILCGDQVYLDAPWSHFLRNRHTRPEMEEIFLAAYRQTWTQRWPGFGFGHLLADAATFFTPDDHELWNNAPHRASVVLDSWFETTRHAWQAVAGDLYARIQTERQWETFDIAPLSFFVADTRFHRTADRKRFMKTEAMNAVANWIRNLAGPGILVLGQPVFTKQTGFFRGTFGDWTLGDYDQYGELVRHLVETKHTLVLLTGDVHFGRVAVAKLPSGAELVEVISSPLTLIDPKAAGQWGRAPGTFPAFGTGVSKGSVATVESHRLEHNHFITLEFSSKGRAVPLAVRAWSVLGHPSPLQGQLVFNRDLY